MKGTMKVTINNDLAISAGFTDGLPVGVFIDLLRHTHSLLRSIDKEQNGKARVKWYVTGIELVYEQDPPVTPEQPEVAA